MRSEAHLNGCKGVTCNHLLRRAAWALITKWSRMLIIFLLRTLKVLMSANETKRAH